MEEAACTARGRGRNVGKGWKFDHLRGGRPTLCRVGISCATTRVKAADQKQYGRFALHRLAVDRVDHAVGAWSHTFQTRPMDPESAMAIGSPPVPASLRRRGMSFTGCRRTRANRKTSRPANFRSAFKGRY